LFDLFEQSFTIYMPLLMAISTFGLGRKSVTYIVFVPLFIGVSVNRIGQ